MADWLVPVTVLGIVLAASLTSAVARRRRNRRTPPTP